MPTLIHVPQAIAVPPILRSETQQSPPRLVAHLHSPEFMFPKTPHLAIPPEAEIRTATLNLYLSNQHPSRVPNVYAVSATAVYVAEHVTFDPIRRTCICISKHTTVGQIRRVMFPQDRICVDGGSTTAVDVAVAVNEISIGDVDRGLIRRETDAIWSAKTVRYYSDIACAGIKAVDKLRELWFGPETLLIPVDWIRKPDRAVRMDNNVIGGIEGA